MDVSKPKRRNMDGGYAWIILAAGFVMNLLAMGLLKSFGILYKELLDMYGHSAGNTAFIGSTASFVQSFGSPLFNSLSLQLGFKRVLFMGGVCLGLGFFCSSFVKKLEIMFLTYSVIAGLGFGLIFSPCSTLINFYFDRRRALANGIVVSASGIGAFIYPFLYRLFIDEYGFNGALLIISGILFNCCVAASLCRNPAYLKRRSKTKEEKTCLSSARTIFSFRWNLFRNKSFFLINVGFAIALLGYGSNYYILPAHVMTLGHSHYDAAVVMTVMGLTESVSRIFMGWFTDLKIISAKMIFAIAMVVGGIASICLPLGSHLVYLCVYAGIIGAFPSIFYTLIAVILIEVLGLDNLPAGYGLATMSMSLVFVIGQPCLGSDFFFNFLLISYS